MEFLNLIWSEYSMEILWLLSPIIGTALMYVLPPQYAKPVAWVLVKVAEKATDIAETKGGVSNKKPENASGT